MLQIISSAAEFEALRPEWSALWREDERATPFQSPEWLLPWLRHLFGGGRLWTLAERDEGTLVSLVPLFRYGARLENLAFLGAGVTDYLDLIGRPVASIPGDWESAALEELRPGSPLLRLGPPETCSVCPVIALSASMSDYLGQIDPKLAIDIRRSRHRLEKAGEIRIERSRDPEELFRLHGARWEERGEEGVLAAEQLRSFHREVVRGFEHLGILRLYYLYLNGKTAAAVYAFHHRARVYGYLTGFDPALAKLSPGTVLLAHAIEQAIAEGATEFDFLRNPEPYKYRWGARDRINSRVRLEKKMSEVMRAPVRFVRIDA